jgi:TetR/AcrR family transcriptional regulator, transcriptional repressor for nem operon
VARYSSDHKEKTRARVVDVAAARIRMSGLDRLGVAGVMAEAGLTHGGFYAHFPSRDALLAAAVEHLFDIAVETVERFETRYGPQALDRYVDFYLSPRHRDDQAAGCPIPALAGEMRNAAPMVKAAFDAGLERLTIRLGALMTEGGRKAALGLLGAMAGVLAVARTVADPRRSNEMLAAARRSVLVD